MRRIRAAATVLALGAALLAGAGSPAQAATKPPVQVNYLFGYYYYEWACRYFGDSLVQGGAFSSYTCYYQHHQPDNAYYWFLYVY